MWSDIKQSVRQFWKHPAFTFVAVLTLALGIGANTAIFSVIDTVLLKPLPYPEADRVVTLWESDPTRNIPQQLVTPPNFFDWQKQNKSFEQIGFYTAFDANIILPDGVQTVRRAHPSSEVFSILRATPLLGRTFTREEDQNQGARAAIISHSFWQNRLGGRADVLGQTLTVDTYGRRDYPIVGVMPPNFSFPDKTELWLSAGWNGIPRTRHGHWFNVIARLKPGVTLQQASAEMATIQGNLAAANRDAIIGTTVATIPLLQQTLGPSLKPALILLWATVCAILLIACVNVANLLLARAVTRRKEFALRAALGANRSRIIRQLLSESVLLSLAGGLAGALLGWWALQLLLHFSPANIPRLDEVHFDLRTLAFTFLISAATGLLFGLAPAWQFSRPQIDQTLRESSHSTSSGRAISNLRSALVTGEIALSLLLLVAAALMIQAFAQILRQDRGFQPDHIITAQLDFSVSGYTTWVEPTQTRPQIKLKQLLDRLATQPGVEYAAATYRLPRRTPEPPNQPIVIEGRQGDPVVADYFGITPNYFATLGIPLLRGRLFTEDDTIESQNVIIINQTLARQHFGGRDPIGLRIAIGGRRNSSIPDEEYRKWPIIVGIVNDTKTLTVNGQVFPQIYVPYWQWPMQTPYAVIRAKGDPAALTALLRREIKSTIPNIPVPKIETMDAILGEVTAAPRFQTYLLTAFSALALALAAIGLYATLAYAVAQRTHEIGIRMALGAERNRVLILIIKDGLKLVALGAAIGILLSLASTKLLTTALFGLRPAATIPILTVTTLLFLIALLASYLPARRASKVNPIEALRHE